MTDLDRAVADIPLTRSARDVLDRAAAIASSRGAPQVDPVDVLKAALESRGTLAAQSIRALGGDPASIDAQLAPPDGSPGLPIRQLLVNANREAGVLGHYQVDSIHLLLALLYTDSPATSAALQKAVCRCTTCAVTSRRRPSPRSRVTHDPRPGPTLLSAASHGRPYGAC